MKLIHIFSFVSVSYSTIQDDVACIFNEFRKNEGVEPFLVAKNLMNSTREIAMASDRAQRPLIKMRGDRDISERIIRAGYHPETLYAFAETRKGNAKQFANFMVQEYCEIILDPKFKHFGVAQVGNYWNLDLGDSYKRKEPIQRLERCENDF